jgi:hypothetical protein
MAAVEQLLGKAKDVVGMKLPVAQQIHMEKLMLYWLVHACKAVSLPRTDPQSLFITDT